MSVHTNNNSKALAEDRRIPEVAPKSLTGIGLQIQLLATELSPAIAADVLSRSMANERFDSGAIAYLRAIIADLIAENEKANCEHYAADKVKIAEGIAATLRAPI